MMQYEKDPRPHLVVPGEPSQWEEQVVRERRDVVFLPDLPEADGEENE